MKKQIILLSAFSIFAIADTMGVRDVLKKQRWSPVAIDENKTRWNYHGLDFMPSGISLYHTCKAMGGDNMYAEKDGRLIAQRDKDGKFTEESGIGLFNKNENLFTADKKYPWICKQEDKELFRVIQREGGVSGRDSLMIERYQGYMIFEHLPEKSTQLKAKPSGELQSTEIAVKIDKNTWTTRTVQLADSNDIKTDIAKKTADAKTVYIQRQGSIQYVGTYNGQSKQTGMTNCSLVSVLQKTDTFETVSTANYKVCGKNVVWLGLTPPGAISKDIEASMRVTAFLCQQNGSAQSAADGVDIFCRALRDKDSCSVEVSVINKSEQLIDKKVMNGCK